MECIAAGSSGSEGEGRCSGCRGHCAALPGAATTLHARVPPLRAAHGFRAGRRVLLRPPARTTPSHHRAHRPLHTRRRPPQAAVERRPSSCGELRRARDTRAPGGRPRCPRDGPQAEPARRRGAGCRRPPAAARREDGVPGRPHGLRRAQHVPLFGLLQGDVHPAPGGAGAAGAAHPALHALAGACVGGAPVARRPGRRGPVPAGWPHHLLCGARGRWLAGPWLREAGRGPAEPARRGDPLAVEGGLELP
mmetsp:Transcript_81650/g.219481  ORF Transcript_81650/g.219481 Transcript_81650/m.219481 type:complete len:250 (-) Transcript_81650:75-824(-)